MEKNSANVYSTTAAIATAQVHIKDLETNVKDIAKAQKEAKDHMHLVLGGRWFALSDLPKSSKLLVQAFEDKDVKSGSAYKTSGPVPIN